MGRDACGAGVLAGMRAAAVGGEGRSFASRSSSFSNVVFGNYWHGSRRAVGLDGD